MELYLEIPYKRVDAYSPFMGKCYTIQEELVLCNVNKFERCKQNLPHAYHYYAFVNIYDLDKTYQDIIQEHYAYKIMEERLFKVTIRRNNNKNFNPKDIEWEGNKGILKERHD